MGTRAQVVQAARAFEGTPFHHQGRSTAGIDCIGLLVLAAKGGGIDLVDRNDYGRQPIPADLLASISSQFDRIEIADILPADLVLFWIADAQTPQHAGLVTGRGMIHAWSGGARRVQEHGITQGWRARIHSAWRLRGLED